MLTPPPSSILQVGLKRKRIFPFSRKCEIPQKITSKHCHCFSEDFCENHLFFREENANFCKFEQILAHTFVHVLGILAKICLNLMSSKYFYKNGTFSHVAAKLCLFCEKPKEKKFDNLRENFRQSFACIFANNFQVIFCGIAKTKIFLFQP